MSAYTDRGYHDFELREFVDCAPPESRAIATDWAHGQMHDLGVTDLPIDVFEGLIALYLISEGEEWE